MKVLGNIYNNTGYACHARDLIRKLYEKGVNILLPEVITNTEWWKANSKAMYDPYFNQITKDVGLYVGLPNLFSNLNLCGYRIAFTQWEATTICSDWIKRLNAMDLVIPGSEFARNAMLNSGVKTNVTTVQWPLNSDWFEKYEKVYVSDLQKSCFTFLIVSDTHKRKNIEDAISGYCYAFEDKFIDKDLHSDSGDPTLLLIKIPKGHINYATNFIESTINNLSINRKPLIILYESEVSITELAGIYKAANATIQITHGEGVGGPLIQSQAQGTPVIYTNWSSLPEYAYQGYPVDICGTEPVTDMSHIGPYQHCEWARINMESYIAQLKKAYEDNKRISWKQPNYPSIDILTAMIKEIEA